MKQKDRGAQPSATTKLLIRDGCLVVTNYSRKPHEHETSLRPQDEIYAQLGLKHLELCRAILGEVEDDWVLPLTGVERARCLASLRMISEPCAECDELREQVGWRSFQSRRSV